MKQKFSKRKAFDFAWQKTKENFWFFVLVLLFLLFLGFFQQITNNLFQKTFSLSLKFLFLFFSLFLWVTKVIIELGLIKISLKILDQKKPLFKDLFSVCHLFFRFLLASFLYSFVVFFGLLLFVIPGILFAIKYQFFPYFIVQKNSPIFESFKESAKITKGARWQLFLFNLLLGLINLGGIFLFLVGLFVAFPITLLAKVHVWSQLLNSSFSQKTLQC